MLNARPQSRSSGWKYVSASSFALYCHNESKSASKKSTRTHQTSEIAQRQSSSKVVQLQCKRADEPREQKVEQKMSQRHRSAQSQPQRDGRDLLQSANVEQTNPLLICCERERRNKFPFLTGAQQMVVNQCIKCLVGAGLVTLWL